MYEVECKVRASHESVRDRLEGPDASHAGRVTQVDTYYDAPDRDFASTDEALRIRRESEPDGSRILLTYKGPLLDDEAKTRTEAETQVDNEAELQDILAGLGYDRAATVHKDRDRFTLAECAVTLDTVEDLGEFVEVEYRPPVGDADLAHARTAVGEVLEELGLDATDGISTSYLGLLLAED